MIITCPHCQTKYQVTYEAIGSAGRKVQCAHCHRAWNQEPTAPAMPEARKSKDIEQADQIFDALAEDGLDEAMAAEESAAAAANGKAKPAAAAQAVPGIDAAALQKQQMAFMRRQNAMISSLPLARLRRAARIAGVVILAGMIGGAYFGRVQIVERYPDLAGLYDSVGLGVNVVGLDFSNLETLKSLSGGNDVLTVSAQIVGRSSKPVPVPPVVVSLLDEAGQAVYEWSVLPRVRDLMAGERATFDTRLSLPPSEAVRVRLGFAGIGAGKGDRGPGPEQGGGAVHAEEPPPPGSPDHSAPDAQPHAAPAAPAHSQPAEADHAAAPAAGHH